MARSQQFCDTGKSSEYIKLIINVYICKYSFKILIYIWIKNELSNIFLIFKLNELWIKKSYLNRYIYICMVHYIIKNLIDWIPLTRWPSMYGRTQNTNCACVLNSLFRPKKRSPTSILIFIVVENFWNREFPVFSRK